MVFTDSNLSSCLGFGLMKMQQACENKKSGIEPLFLLAGETRLEHATNGFGDHYSTN
jgi:hypothetical protein